MLTFEVLIATHGIGPALAVAILGTHSPSALVDIVATTDLGALTLVPGVGKKTAERLLVELRNRLDLPMLDPVSVGSGGQGGTRRRRRPRGARPGSGYAPDEVRDALRELPANADASSLLRDALKLLGARACVTSSSTRTRSPTTIRSTTSACGRVGSSEFVGQRELKEHLSIVLEAAKKRGQPADHLLMAGPPGLGKTSMAGIVAAEMGVHLHITSGPALERAGDLAAILTKLEEGDVLFIDEIHRLSRAVEEILYPAMEDFQLDIVVGKGPAASQHPADAAAVHARRRDHAHRHDHRPAARPVRSGRAARLLLATTSSKPIVVRAAGHPARRHPDRGRVGDRPPIARHAAHRQPAAAPRARLRRGARRRHDQRGTRPRPA